MLESLSYSHSERFLAGLVQRGDHSPPINDHQCGLSSIPRLGVICTRVIGFLGSLLCAERFFSEYSVFPSPQKPIVDLISVYSVPKEKVSTLNESSLLFRLLMIEEWYRQSLLNHRRSSF